ncbi:helix-turn-helix domain-containing protein [Pseudonocardia endophytica]|uniref:AraC-like DNA-binding protein n=1 Tax=Pseudonocardia endophytica TaxID=401976 RepID=A0A4R1HSZ1_PSEEN|nr:helix-turn-helix transcriptional regulator [Pseudonocardia endophytica]TCK25308.1 AraC-like DNA-binding protein [Pseudonocardia endophytica]
MAGPAIPTVETDGTHRWRTSARLREHVREIWAWRQGAGPPGTHQGVPGGHLTVVLCLDGDVEVLKAPDPARGPGRFVSSVAGLHDAPAVLATGPAQTGMQLELTWRGARALLGLPAGELAGDVVDLAVLLPGLDALLDRLHGTPTWPARFALLDAWLCDLLDTRERPSVPAPELARAWDRLMSTGGTARVEDLAADVGWSRRHLGARFRAETGLGTKTAARLIRFERALGLLRSPARPGLAEVAAVCGYADQPHLARDFRDLAGLTATEWLAERSL